MRGASSKSWKRRSLLVVLLGTVLSGCGAPAAGDESGPETSDSSAQELARPRTQPTWLGNTRLLVSRAGGGCDASVPFPESGFWFDSWARTRAIQTLVCFEVWAPGLTDRENPDLWKELDVQVHMRFAPDGPVETQYVNRFDRRGNNARYALDLRALDRFKLYTCPNVPLRPSADGQAIEAEAEFFFTVNGQRLPSEDESPLRGVYSENRGGFLDTCAGVPTARP